MIRLTAFADKHVAVFGLGGSGLAAADALRTGGARVVVWDDNEEACNAAARAGHTLQDLTSADWGQLHSLVLAPGVPLTHPEPHWTVKKAQASGTEIIGDVELYLRQRSLDAAAAPFIAITGSNGKSTTTALTAHLLTELGVEVCVGGNIGKAILTLPGPAESRFHVIEMSSYQIDLTPSLAPTVGVLLNITPDHLDRHGSLDHYANVKARVVEKADAACICVDDPRTSAIAETVAPPSRLYAFTNGKGAAIVPRLYAIGSTLFLHSVDGGVGQSQEIASLEGVTGLRGAHNVENALAGLSILRALADRYASGEPDLAERLWQPGQLQQALQSFPGLAHRLQQIARRNHTAFVNDSKATNGESTEKALASFPGNIYWIAGGRAKQSGIESLAPMFSRIAKAYLIGEAAKDFSHVLRAANVPFEIVVTMDRAVAQAARDAAQSTKPDPVVLLSPACASFDQYRNFEVRGNHFTKLVEALPGVTIEGVVR